MHLNFNRRRFLGVSAGLAGLAGLAACDNPYFGGRSGGSASGVSVLMANWGQLYNDAMTTIGDEYASSSGGVPVSWDFSDEWKAKLLTQINGDVAPDISYANWVELPELNQANAFAALDEYASAASLDRDAFIGPMYDSCLHDGTLFALPGGADFIAMFWNKDLYRDAGLDPEAPPTTAEELVGHSLQILQKKGDGTLTRVGWVPTPDQYIQWALLFGGSFYDADAQKVTADSEANIDAMEWVASYVKKLDVNKLAAFSELPSYNQPGNPFASKQSAYIMTGFWAYEGLDKTAPDIDYGVAMPPTRTGDEAERAAYLIQGWQWAIPRNAKDPEKAWQFLKFALVDNSARMGYETLNGPCYKAQFDEFRTGLADKIGTDNRMTPYLDVFTQIGEVGQEHWPAIPASSYYYDQVTRAYDQVTRGEASATEALTAVQKAVTAKLDDLK